MLRDVNPNKNRWASPPPPITRTDRVKDEKGWTRVITLVLGLACDDQQLSYYYQRFPLRGPGLSSCEKYQSTRFFLRFLFLISFHFFWNVRNGSNNFSVFLSLPKGMKQSFPKKNIHGLLMTWWSWNCTVNCRSLILISQLLPYTSKLSDRIRRDSSERWIEDRGSLPNFVIVLKLFVHWVLVDLGLKLDFVPSSFV